MKKNESGFDRVLRVILAAAIAVLYFTGVLSGTWAIVLGRHRCDFAHHRVGWFLPAL